MKLTQWKWAVAAVAALGCAQLANAAAVVGSMSEPFADPPYANATVFANSSTLNGGSGWNLTGTTAANDATANWGININAGAARTATSPGLTATAIGYLAASGNKLTMDAATPNATQNIGRLLGGQTIDSGTTYFSLQMSKGNDTIRTINLAFFGGTTAAAAGTERFAIAQVGATAGNSNGNITMLMNNVNPGGILAPANPIAMGINVPHLMVGKIVWNDAGFETVSLWVDPANVTTEALAGAVYVSTNAFELTGINAIRPFVGNSATVGAGTVPGAIASFDEIRIGGTWASVTSQPVGVPEPTSALLLTLSGLALGAFRRR